MTKADLAIIDKFAGSQGIDILNTRAFKIDGKYVLTVGSISSEKSKKDIDFEGNKFDITYGEFAPYLEETLYYMKEAAKYCANETQEKMCQKYIEHLESGDIDAHKDS